MALPLGRGVGRIRTPLLIRDFLTGQGAFAEDPPEDLSQRFNEGAYVAQIHQRVKQHIIQRSKELRFKYQYQWPRRHSFNARINDLLLLGLLVKTGEAAPEKVEPQERGAGQLGSAGGFSKKLWVRLAPGADTRPEWADLMGYIDRYYAEKALAEGRPPPNIRPKRGELPTAIQEPQALEAPEAPEQLRPRRRRAAEAAATPEILEAVQRLEQQRQLLQRSAVNLYLNGINANSFENLGRIIGEFHVQVLRLYGRTPFPDLPEALEILNNCLRVLLSETAMTQRRVQAVNNCRNSARLVAEAITRPLQPPEAAPAAPQRPQAPARARRTRRPATEEAPPAPTPPEEEASEEAVAAEALEAITERWQAAIGRIAGWERPNSTNATNLLDRFVQEVTEAHPEIREDDVDSVVDDVRQLLEEYQTTERSDFDTSEDYQEARAEAWQGFVDELGDVDFSGLEVGG